MTSGLRNSAGTDFDSLFATGQGNQLFYIYANDGTDVGQRYLPASAGSSATACGFLDSTNSDVGPKLCLPGTQYTHLITVGMSSSFGGIVYYGWVGTGDLTPKSLNGYEINGFNLITSDGIGMLQLHINTSSRPFTSVTVERRDTGLTYSLSFYQYSQAGRMQYRSDEVSASSAFFTASDVGRAVQLVITVN